jgi:hypothetical protein
MFLVCGLKITFTSSLKLKKIEFDTTKQPLFPSLDSHFSQVVISTLLFLVSSCCISSLGKRAYGRGQQPPQTAFHIISHVKVFEQIHMPSMGI